MSTNWVFHPAQWGDVRVMVMPRSCGGQVYDSNTGVVLEAPYHRAIEGQPVVNDGRMPNCDEAALNQIVNGDHKKPWRKSVPYAWTVPTYRVTGLDTDEAGWGEFTKLLCASMPLEEVEARMEQTLGWCTDSVSCAVCGLTIPGHLPDHVASQARAFGWGLDAAGSPVCPAHPIAKPFPSDEEIRLMENAGAGK